VLSILGCNTSTEINSGTPTTNSERTVKPRLGSQFVYNWVTFDSVGNINPFGGRSDSTWKVLSEDTTVNGHQALTRFASVYTFDSNSINDQFYFQYLANGDLNLLSVGFGGDFGKWLQLPIKSSVPTTVTLDSVIMPTDTVTIGLKGSIVSRLKGRGSSVIGDSTYSTLIVDCEYHLFAFQTGRVDTAHFDGIRTLEFAPGIGFFTRIESDITTTEFDGARPSRQHERGVMTSYHLIQRQ
jgi:hypothetical protein